MRAEFRNVGQITKGKHKGALVRPCIDSMDSPFYRGANDEDVAICTIFENGETGLIVALKENEMRWL
jgi:hypothetical protein